MTKTAAQPEQRRTEMIPMLTMVEVPVLSETEKADMIASLKEAEDDIRAGRGVRLKAGEIAGWLSERFKLAKAKRDDV